MDKARTAFLMPSDERHLPAQEDEQLVELWLWSGQEGVFSHETALALYDLSDALP